LHLSLFRLSEAVMRVRTKVWIVIGAVCIGLTVYEIPKALFIWRHMRMLVHAEEIFKDDTDAKPALKEEIKDLDPEAFDILRYCITNPNDEELAVLAAIYPQNEFFLAQLVEKTLIDANLVDSRAVLAIADRLIELSPENAHYRYLKGWAILNRPGESGRERDALEQFEFGNSLPTFYSPYSKYKERVDVLGEKLRISPIEMVVCGIKDRRLYSRLWKQVHSWDESLVPIDRELLRRLTAAISKIGARLVDDAQNNFLVESGMFIIMVTDSLRLREFDMPEDESGESRFRVSQAVEIMNLVRQYNNDLSSLLIPMAAGGLIATIVILSFLPLLIFWLFVAAINWIRGRAQQTSVGIKAYVLFLIGLCGIYGLFFVLTLLNERIPGRFLGSLVSIGAAVIVWILLWLLTRVRPVVHSRFQRARRWAAIICGVLWAIGAIVLVVDCIWHSTPSNVSAWLEFLGVLLIWFVFCSIIWVVAAYRQHLFRVIPYGRLLRSRFVQLLLVLLLMTGISILLRPIPVAPLVLVFLTILFVGLIATHVSEARFICLDGIRHLFGRNGEIVNTRTKMVRITATALIMGWVTVLAVNHIFAAKFSKLNTIWTEPLSVHRPLPQATQETYERVVLGRETKEVRAGQPREKFLDSSGQRYLYLASPGDISAIIAERKAAGKPFSDKELSGLLIECGHDVRPVILNAMGESNAVNISRRAEWGDKTVKQELERIFEDKMAAFSEAQTDEVTVRGIPSGLESLLKLARDLAYVSEAEEAKNRLSRLLMPVVKITKDKPEKPGLFEGLYSKSPELRLQAKQRNDAYNQWRSEVEQFFASLGKLPSPQAEALFKSYFLQTQIINLVDEQDLDMLAELIEKLSDRELAELILETVIESPPVEESYDIPVGRTVSVFETKLQKHIKDVSHRFLEAIYPHLNEESIPLLLEHLDSNNEQLRAFVVWRLTSLGYEWPRERLDALLKDGCWKVRLNALFAFDADDLKAALDDENGVVRVIAQILGKSRQNKNSNR
jgi:hypothetical protein